MQRRKYNVWRESQKITGTRVVEFYVMRVVARRKSAAATWAAELRETSASAELPPISTATVNGGCEMLDVIAVVVPAEYCSMGG